MQLISATHSKRNKVYDRKTEAEQKPKDDSSAKVEPYFNA